MLCEKNIKAIVMLTRLYECEETLTKLKCTPYWNDSTNLKIGNYSIQVTYYENCITYIKRKLMIKNIEQDHIYFIDHYHYIEWQDKQIPIETQSLVSLIKRVNNEHEINNWPIVIHCSAGIGRTGTYIALDLLLEQYERKNSLNIYELIVALRHQRLQFVQTWQQYKFIHVSLLEYYLFDNKWITIEESKTKLNLLCSRNDVDNMTMLESEYERIVSFKDKLRSTLIHSNYSKKFNSTIFRPC
jgi:protein tyrosine phosphatase